MKRTGSNATKARKIRRWRVLKKSLTLLKRAHLTRPETVSPLPLSGSDGPNQSPSATQREIWEDERKI
jgi:hypothetical protein